MNNDRNKIPKPLNVQVGELTRSLKLANDAIKRKDELLDAYAKENRRLHELAQNKHYELIQSNKKYAEDLFDLQDRVTETEYRLNEMQHMGVDPLPGAVAGDRGGRFVNVRRDPAKVPKHVRLARVMQQVEREYGILQARVGMENYVLPEFRAMHANDPGREQVGPMPDPFVDLPIDEDEF